ncbi:DUF5791 family protein [Halorubrum sp. AD140]|uniref:DUF5791 family protein n=1 Tax=Halorubrum sp. AD140 TaxID=3050073 RepID=UPI002ACC68C9|nr:DUF5791 family protein [Halorubrum sp. AD140]MDZ5810265.1 DUF5791 family protein [Halorubrum sp. AD140]
MFHEVVENQTASGVAGDGETPDADADAVTAAALLASFETLVSEAVAEAGRERVGDETDAGEAAIESAAAGDVEGLTVEEGAAIVAVTADRDADAIVAELRDHLLMGMATAVLDVDTVAAGIEADLTGQEVQQALEGRAAMTLGQLAEIMAVIERRKP